ncbi:MULTISPECIES: DUF1294 domain-containing protein [Bacillus]|uniref:DUF1294 domain-containing protein n=1 Tax=Bacillus TaxID=1386 RepID=UPI00030CD7C8|nr:MULTISPECIES: DUF1294 domain-containing protein [Bacillus]
MKWILLYLFICSVIGFVVMGIDKQRAIHKKYRISEATLWVLAIIGGAIGATFGMFYFRHKTKHMIFRIGLPVLAFIHILLMITY